MKVNKLICIIKNGGPNTRMVTQNVTRTNGDVKFMDGALGQGMNIESSRKLKTLKVRVQVANQMAQDQTRGRV